MLSTLHKSLDELLQWLLITLMVVLTLVVMVAVFYRRFGDSLIWYDEVASVLMAWITYYGAALAALRRRHIGFDGLLLRFPLGARLSAAAVAEISVIGFFVLLTWAGVRVLQVIGDENLISLPWVPVTLTQSVIPISATLFILCELLSLPAYWQSVREGRSLEHPEFEVERS